jgi:hypothetical protein
MSQTDLRVDDKEKAPTDGKADEVQTVQQRSPVGGNGIGIGPGIKDTKLSFVGSHCLAGGDTLIVEAIIERRQSNEANCGSKTGSEMRKNAIILDE